MNDKKERERERIGFKEIPIRVRNPTDFFAAVNIYGSSSVKSGPMKGGRRKNGSAQWHLFPVKRRKFFGGSVCKIERLTLDLSARIFPQGSSRSRGLGARNVDLRQDSPPPPPAPFKDPLVDAYNLPENRSTMGQNCRQYFDRFVLLSARRDPSPSGARASVPRSERKSRVGQKVSKPTN